MIHETLRDAFAQRIEGEGDPFDADPDELFAMLGSMARSALGADASAGLDGPRGFGRVYVRDASSRMGVVLAGEGWRSATLGDQAAKLDGCLYHDDPFQAGQPFGLDALVRAAETFARDANALFDESDGRFFVRPVEVIRWEMSSPYSPNFYERDEGDFWVFDLMEGQTRSAVADRLINKAYWEVAAWTGAHVPVGHALAAAERRFAQLNLARSMFGGDLPSLKAPGREAVRARVEKLRRGIQIC